MISGGQCVMTCGTALMLLWSADSWAMEVSRNQCGLIGVNMSKPRTSELDYQFSNILICHGSFHMFLMLQLNTITAGSR